ncbi:hypothetical protein [Spirosoma sp. 209]|uniref:hypothetical protein n=1 Tax=Spirosoma sp. 209 TaxID=1955701 RepID=UPI00098CFE1E|nr:hypothetical protein [Spirosoma sp. 209]
MESAETREQQLINSFLANYFDLNDQQEKTDVLDEEKAIINECLEYVGGRFKKMKYILGTALDFTLLAQIISKHDTSAKVFRSTLTREGIFNQYRLITERGESGANTLTVEYAGHQFGIRKIEEGVLALFRSMKRSNYPSAYVYNTGQWQKYQDLLELCFRPSETARLLLVNELIKYGLSELAVNSYYVRDVPRPHIFPRVITEYPRSVKGENGGLIYQAIAFGYVTADRPHLSILADKVRTGSSRQKRFGDIDGYNGLDLELSVEVKDFEINEENIPKELSSFVNEVAENQVLGIAFVRDVTDAAHEYLTASSVKVMTQDDLLGQVDLWDWQKQEKALQGVLHYIAHVEQDVNAVKRLLSFIQTIDPNHTALAFL